MPTRLTVRQALAYVQPPISRATLYRLLGQGRITAVKRGRNTLIESASLDRYAADLPVATFRAPRKAA
jgi:excisionase family DNA binding protein